MGVPWNFKLIEDASLRRWEGPKEGERLRYANNWEHRGSGPGNKWRDLEVKARLVHQRNLKVYNVAKQN